MISRRASSERATGRTVLCAALLLAAPRAQDPAPLADLLAEHCLDCHGGAAPEAGLDLERLPDPRTLEGLTRLRLLRDRMASREMPPPGYSEPDARELAPAIAFVDAAVRAAPAWLPEDEGLVTVRRLSRAELARATFDLLGVTSERLAELPPDDLAYGFDSIGGAMAFSALHLERYLAMAEDLAAQVLDLEDPRRPTVRRFEAEELRAEHSVLRDAEVVTLLSRVEVWDTVVLPRDGDYELRVRAAGDQAGDAPARLVVLVDGEELAAHDVPEPRARPSVKVTRARLARGKHELALRFANDHYQPAHPDPAQRDRNLHLDWLEVVGPLDQVPPPAGSQWWLGQDPGRGTVTARAEAVLRPLLERAWRRPVQASELSRLVALVRGDVRQGRSFAAALRLAVQAVLASPWFWLRLEPRRGGEPLDAFALATRLSFFLWGSIPDAALLARARAGDLGEAPVLDAEVRRMLADPRAQALASGFAAQWLELRAIQDAAPDPGRFPALGDALRAALRAESEALFLCVLRERRDVRELLTADYTFVEATLAAHYGIAFPPGGEVMRVPAPAGRLGLLGHAGILLLTSQPTRTSVVKRGKWILDNLLGAPPPLPPPGNDSFPPEVAVDEPRSLRAQMALHRRAPSCASCHVRMDALGFALEGFDAVGRARAEADGSPIDTSGALPGGRKVSGLEDLARTLAQDPRFPRALAAKLWVHAVGRELGPADAILIEATLQELPRERVTLEDLILGIVRQPGFHGGARR